MKKILLLIFVIISIKSWGQTGFPVTQQIGSGNTLVQVPANGGFRGGLINRVFFDTTAANLSFLDFYDGSQIKTLSPNALFWRDSTNRVWVQIIPGGGGSGTQGWQIGGNTNWLGSSTSNEALGWTTGVNKGINFMTNGVTNVALNSGGLVLKSAVSDTSAHKVMTFNPTTKEWGYGYWFGGSGGGSVTSVGLTMPSAFSVANSPITTSGTLAVTGAGTSAQYIRGDGALATYTGGIATASNGLTLASNNVKWGGTLINTTTIPQAGFSIEFTGLGKFGIGKTPVNKLHVYESNSALSTSIFEGGNTYLQIFKDAAPSLAVGVSMKHIYDAADTIRYADMVFSNFTTPLWREGMRKTTRTLRLSQPQLTSGSTLNAFGDSFTVGVGATSTDSNYINLFAAEKRLAITNSAVSGSMVADQAAFTFLQTVDSLKNYIYFLGVNDQRIYGDTAYKYTYFKRGHLEQVAWLGIKNINKKLGNSSNITYAGTWTNPGIYNNIVKASTVASSTATTTVYGTSVLISTIIQNANTGQFTVHIDGVLKETFNNIGSNVMTSYLGATYMPYLLHYDGLGDSLHTVVITITSSASPSYINWIAGSGGNDLTFDEPTVYVSNISRMTSAGYTAHGGSDANVYKFNRAIDSNINYLASIGVNCVLTKAGEALNPSTDLDPDGIHPDNSGFRKFFNGFLWASNSILYPRDRQRSGSNYINGIPTSTPISALSGATGTNSINNVGYTQTWQWNSLNGIGLSLSSSSTAMTGTSNQLFRAFINGASTASNVTSAAVVGSNTATGTNSTSQGGQFSASGGATINVGVQASATGGGTNLAAWFDRGTVRIGTAGIETGILQITGVTSGTASLTVNSTATAFQPSVSLDMGNNTLYGNSNAYNDQTGTTYTLLASDNGKVVTISNASAITLTVPAGLPTGFNCTVVQKGAGVITFTASSTTINNRQSFTQTAGQYSAATILMYAANTFLTQGDMQ